MRAFTQAFVAVAVLFHLPSTRAADAPTPPATSRQTTYEELMEFGEAVHHIQDYRDNRYLYDARVHELFRDSLALENSQIEFKVLVERVTLEEVFIRVEDAGYTRILLQHSQPPQFGNMRTVYYSGSPSTVFYNQFAKPVTLRIGSEIPLEMASRLRKRDQLLIRAQIGCMRTIIGPTFRPHAIATMANWTVVKAIPAEPASS